MKTFQCRKCGHEQKSMAQGSCVECKKNGDFVMMTQADKVFDAGLAVRLVNRIRFIADRITGKEIKALKVRHASDLYEQKCKYDELQCALDRSSTYIVEVHAKLTEVAKKLELSTVELDLAKKEAGLWESRQRGLFKNVCDMEAYLHKMKSEKIRRELFVEQLKKTQSSLRGQITRLKNKAAAKARSVEDNRND